ncbi:hypothetical protein WJX72_001797 [[Myrmecia] bisecta]|uniref:Uncharacterized protein n=1 Tax=[Myrmecia] bisecta TaxID=41462 RepID=A0AAW1QP87_9CHLO
MVAMDLPPPNPAAWDYVRSVLQQLTSSYHSAPLLTAAFLALIVLGLFAALRITIGFVLAVYKYFLRPGKNLKSLGSWAVVTGATDGIGRAYCDALAKRGINLVLISRTPAKLETTASELTSRFKVQLKMVQADFAKADADTWARISASLKDLDVGLLINNVGLSYEYPEFFDLLDEGRIDDLIQINVVATTKMSHIVLPIMKQKRRGAIVNIGSAAATVVPSSPLLSVYAGTKAYIDQLSRSLSVEYASSNITIQNQAPLFVATKMSKIRRPTLQAPSPATWVRSAMCHIGYEAVSCPYWVHAVMWNVIAAVPKPLINAYVLGFHLSLRKRALKKKTAATKQQ